MESIGVPATKKHMQICSDSPRLKRNMPPDCENQRSYELVIRRETETGKRFNECEICGKQPQTSPISTDIVEYIPVKRLMTVIILTKGLVSVSLVVSQSVVILSSTLYFCSFLNRFLHTTPCHVFLCST